MACMNVELAAQIRRCGLHCSTSLVPGHYVARSSWRQPIPPRALIAATAQGLRARRSALVPAPLPSRGGACVARGLFSSIFPWLRDPVGDTTSGQADLPAPEDAPPPPAESNAKEDVAEAPAGSAAPSDDLEHQLASPEGALSAAAPVSSRSMHLAERVIPGTESEVILQAFNWESHRAQSPSWWGRLSALVPEVAALGFTSVWLPPPSASLAPQGYLPQDLYNLNSAYGSEAELRALLGRLREGGVRPIADLVVNHRAASSQDERGGWTRFPGWRPDWDEHAVTCDSGGKGHASTGEVFQGVANIDHTQEFVRRDLKDWMRWLKEDVGFTSFRFDFAKGYSPQFVREYLESVQPQLTIGEYWDSCNYTGKDYALDYDQNSHRQRIVDWIDGTVGQSAAFDFTTKAILQEAARSGEWSRLQDQQGRAPGLLGFWPSRSVTFVDNHDTGSTQAHWPFPGRQVVQGYAYILTHPGIPTVFFDHLFEWGQETKDAIVALLKCRHRAGVTCNSPLTILKADANSYVAQVGETLLVEIGSSYWASEHPPEGKQLELVAKSTNEHDYAVWLLSDVE